MIQKRLPFVVRFGAGLTLFVALSAFALREAQGQQAPAGGRRVITLGEAARLAAAQSYDVEGATYRVQGAQARVNQSRAALLPQISLSPNWTSHTLNSASFGFNFPAEPGQPALLDPDGQIIGPVRMWDFRAKASQALYDQSSRERIRAAQAGVTVADADVVATSENAASNAAAAYVRAQRAEGTLAARIADSSLAADLLQIARDQLAAGVGVALDVTRAQSQLAGARAALIGARNDRNTTRLDLLRTLNLPLDTQVELSDSLSAIEGGAQAEAAAVAAAMQARPELKSIDAQVAQAKQNVKAIRADGLPKVEAFGDVGPTGFINNLLTTYQYGVQLSWPVFEGGLRKGQEAEQQARLREYESRRRDLQQQITVEVRTALLDLASARDQVDAARETVQLAEQEVDQARDRFRAGVAGNADVITASLTLNNARTALVDALTRYQAARVSLAHAEGSVTQLR